MLLFLLKKYVWIINALLVVAISYSVAGMINGTIRDRIESGDVAGISADAYKSRYEDVKVPHRPRSYYDHILRTNLFGTGTAPELSQPDAGTWSPAEGLAPRTSLNLELLGTLTRRTADPYSRAGSVAVIKNMDNGMVKSYSRGQRVDLVGSEIVEMGEIDNCEAIILRADGPESISCRKDLESIAFLKRSTSRSGGGKRPSGSGRVARIDGVKKVREGVYQIEKKMFDEFLDQPKNIINAARIVPRDDGIRVFGIKSKSVFFRIGLRNGDTIHKINEVSLSDMENAILLFSELKHQNEFTIDFTRRGKRRSNRYSVY